MKLELWKNPEAGLAKIGAEVTELLACNPVLQVHGLSLTAHQAEVLVLSQRETLEMSERMAVGGSILPKLAEAFCDSPYIGNWNLSDSLAALTEIFYNYKNESEERLTDDELIQVMVSCFNGACQGSLDLLETREMDLLARKARGMVEPQGEGAEETEDE